MDFQTSFRKLCFKEMLYLTNLKEIIKMVRVNKFISPVVKCLFAPRQRGIVVPFVRRRLRCIHSFGYYTNMVQQIKFIIHTNIQPLSTLFFTQGQRSR